MISFKKSVKQASFVFIIFCTIFRPEVVAGKVFDRVAARVNGEIITLSSIEERVLVLKQKFRNDLAEIDEKEIFRQALEMIISEKLQLQQAKKMGFEVDDESVEAAVKNIERQNGLQEGQLAELLEAEGSSLETYKNRIRDQIIVSKITKFEFWMCMEISTMRGRVHEVVFVQPPGGNRDRDEGHGKTHRQLLVGMKVAWKTTRRHMPNKIPKARGRIAEQDYALRRLRRTF